MLEIERCSKIFSANVVAVREVDLQVNRGQMVAIIGPSGAGKSTLLRFINRLVEPTYGVIRIDGTDITALKGAALRGRRAQCGMIFQQFNLVQRLDVITNVLLGRLSECSLLRSMFQWFTPRDRAMAIMALDRVGIADKALQRADTLSGGEQQRVAIARCLVQNPKLILADEPISSLDPRSATVVMNMLQTINREDGITILINLHDVETARLYCHRIIGMSGGRIVFDGAPGDTTGGVLRRIYGLEGDHDQSEACTKQVLADTEEYLFE